MYPKKLRSLLCRVLSIAALLALVFRWIHSPPRHRRRELGASATTPHLFLVTPDARCEEDPPFLVLLVTTRQGEVAERTAIRETWGAERRIGDRRVCTFFLLGHGGPSQRQIERESRSHGDIIQGNFTDVYYNLTLKVLMGLEWSQQFCPSASFVMKTDSDMFINIFYLTHLLKAKNASRFFSGQLMHDIQPVKDKSNKWYISHAEFAPTRYPDYCSGTGYILSGDLAGKIWSISKSVPLLKLEDAYVGLCLARLQIAPVKMTSRRVFFTRKVPFSVCRYRTLVTSHRVSPSELRRFWKAMEEAGAGECPMDPHGE